MLSKFTRNSRNLFLVGALLAVVAFGLVFSVLSKAQQTPAAGAANVPQAPKPVLAPSLIATQNIPAFTQFSDPHAAVSKYFAPAPGSETYPTDYVKGEPGLADLIAQGGTRHTAFAIAKGQPLLASELLTNTVQGAVDYAPLLQKGEVAEAVSVPALASDNGNIQPSDHVNLLLSLKLDVRYSQFQDRKFMNKIKLFVQSGTKFDPTVKPDDIVGYYLQTQTTLENLRVLGVSQNVYTLAMTNQQALMLKFVKDMATATSGNYVADLVVRSSSDTDGAGKYFTTSSITSSDLFKLSDTNKYSVKQSVKGANGKVTTKTVQKTVTDDHKFFQP